MDEKVLQTAINLTNAHEEKLHQIDDRLDNLTETQKILEAATSDMSSPVGNTLLGLVTETNKTLNMAVPLLANLNSSIERGRLESQAAKEGKKVVEKDGKASLENLTYFETFSKYAVPIAMTAAGVIAGIGVWEGSQKAYGWVTSEDEPIDI